MAARQLFRFSIPLGIFILLIIFFWYGLRQPHPREIPSPLINKPLPEINSETLTDDPVLKIKNQDFLGHITLLNVWSSWCKTCQQENAVLLDVSRSGKFVLYGLNYKDKREKALKWLKENGNPYYQNIYDPKGSLGINLGVYGVPETFLIDQNGIVRYKYVGPINPTVWQTDFLPRIMKLANDSLAQNK